MTLTPIEAIGHVAVAAAALERGIDDCLTSCLQGLPLRKNVAILSRLTFRQRLNILHELALDILSEDEHERFKAWRRRVAKAWARSTRSMVRTRIAQVDFDETTVRRIARHLEAESTIAQQWAQILVSPA